MFIYSNLDRAVFQKLLANAFAVQQSQMDRQWLSSIVEIQALISSGQLDVNGTLQLIVDRAQTVANATGVAIGLFKRHQLVYRAGSGSAADYVGRQVMATLSVPADTTSGREILRVEDAETDTRIQAEICRQFGAKSLLILLIYHEQSVAGVLEILFGEAHAFQESEVRAYRLMAGLVGEAMAQAARLERERTEREKITTAPLPVVANLPIPEAVIPEPMIPNPAIPNPAILNMAVPKRAERNVPQTAHPGSRPTAAWDPIPQPREATTAGTGKFSIFRQPVLLAATLIDKAKRVPWQGQRWNMVAATAAVLVLASAVIYHNRRPAPSFGSAPAAGVQSPTIVEPQPAVLRVKEVSASGSALVRTAGVPMKSTGSGKARLRRTRVSEYEVEYLGDDVTIRHFRPQPEPAPRRVRAGSSEVAYIGDDVTVHYFNPKAVAATPTRPIGAAPMQKQ